VEAEEMLVGADRCGRWLEVSAVLQWTFLACMAGACEGSPITATDSAGKGRLLLSTDVSLCSYGGADASRRLDPAARLRLADCLERRGRLEDALRVLAFLEDDHASRRDLMEAGSERVDALLLHQVPISGIPNPLRLSDSRIPLAVLEGAIGATQGLFVWDSGAEGTVLDREVCSQLGLRTFGGLSVKDASGGEQGGSRVGILADPVVLGPVRLEVAPVLCTDLSQFRSSEPRFLGALGGNVLGSHAYQLNLRARRLVIGATRSSDVIRLKATFTRGLPYVDAEVDGHRLQFLLDTGSDRSTLSRDSLADLGHPTVSKGEPRTGGNASGAGAQSGEFVVARSLRSGGEERQNVRFWIGSKNLLGIDFLGERTLFVNRETGVVGFLREP
jgi:hypothetical protein